MEVGERKLSYPQQSKEGSCVFMHLILKPGTGEAGGGGMGGQKGGCGRTERCGCQSGHHEALVE